MLRNLKIKSIFILCWVFAGVLVVTYSVVVIFNVRETLETSLIHRGKTNIAQLITIQAKIDLPQEIFSEPDLVKTQETFNSFFKKIDTDEILRIKVWDKNAKIIASNDPSIVGKTFPNNAPFQEAKRGVIASEIKAPVSPENVKEKGYGQLMEVYVPISYADGSVAGVIETYTILDNLNKEIRNAQNDVFLETVIIDIPLLFFLGILFMIFYRNIISRINTLIKFTKVISEGRFDEKIEVLHNDELSEIAIAMNKMAGNIAGLLVTSGELEKQVKTRTAELGSRVEEVEKINKIMIDRELKMIELKEEIAKLKGQ